MPSCRDSTIDHKVKQEEPSEKVNHTKAAGTYIRIDIITYIKGRKYNQLVL